jgi:putative addiction module component (TIGR02574 family)
MNPTIDALVAQAEQLSEEDRELLLIRLQLALAPPVDPSIEAAWIEEAERRLDAIERGEMKTISWEEVRKGLGLS